MMYSNNKYRKDCYKFKIKREGFSNSPHGKPMKYRLQK